MKSRKKEFVIGLSVILTLAILLFGIEYLKGINLFHTANYYYATFHNVDGLTQSAPVTLNGFKVGLVREIKYDYANPGNVEVELSLDKKLKVPKGTKAVLQTDFLGTGTINLILGPSNDFHNVGDRLIGENAAGLMQSISGDVMPRVADMADKLDSLLTAVTTVATDPALLASLHSLSLVMSNLETSTQLLNRTLTPAPGVVKSADEAMIDVKEIAANLSKVSSDLAEISATLRNSPLDSVIGNIHALSDNLLAISRQLESKDSSLGLLLNDPALYNNVNNCAAHIDSILLDLKQQPKKYIPSIKVF